MIKMPETLTGYYLSKEQISIPIFNKKGIITKIKIYKKHIRYYTDEIETDCGDAARALYGPLSCICQSQYIIFDPNTFKQIDIKGVDWVAQLRFSTIDEYIKREKLTKIFI